MVSTRNKFKSIAIYSSLKDSKVLHLANQIVEVLSNLDIECVFPNSSQITSSMKKRGLSDKNVVKQCDLVIAIGGDGTLLTSARNFGVFGVPILGINLGNLGFLTDIQPSNMTADLTKIIKGEYIKDQRIFLEARIGEDKTKYKALNEVVLHSGSIAQLIEYDLFINDEFVYRQRADGLIVSTSTGSTAYSLSGNGPIISPELNALILLPMFPHSLNARTLVASDNSEIRLKVADKSKAYLSMDSHMNMRVSSRNDVYIKKANEGLTLIHPTDHSFFSSCRNKLGWSLGVPTKKS